MDDGLQDVSELQAADEHREVNGLEEVVQAWKVAEEPPNLSQLDEVSAELRYQLDFHGGNLNNKIWNFLMNKKQLSNFSTFSSQEFDSNTLILLVNFSLPAGVRRGEWDLLRRRAGGTDVCRRFSGGEALLCSWSYL